MSDTASYLRQVIDTIKAATIKNEEAEAWRDFFERKKNEEYRQVSCLSENNRMAREALGLSVGI